jgi:hypothetical protein
MQNARMGFRGEMKQHSRTLQHWILKYMFF